MQKHSWGTLIVVSPESPRILKFRFTKTAILVLAITALAAFLTVVAVETAVGRLSMRDPARLKRENQELKLTNLNIAASKAVVEPQVDEMQRQAEHILELLDQANSE
jgi:hypothetical protein